MHLLKQTLDAIRPVDRAVMAAAQREIDYCLKPPGSLGKLETMARQIAGITGQVHNAISKKAIVVMMADNGVYTEGVAMYPQDITRIGAEFVTTGRMGVNFLARQAGADIIAVDIGIQVDVDLPGVINRKVRYGTANFLKEPAMTREEAIQAIEAGIEVTMDAIDRGYDLIGTGEIGIGNTTASSAVLFAFTGAPIDRVVGRGAGLTDEAFARKKAVVEEAVRLHRPDPDDPLDVLAKVGGLDIAGMVGTYLACAARRVRSGHDGLISNVAALAAMRCKTRGGAVHDPLAHLVRAGRQAAQGDHRSGAHARHGHAARRGHRLRPGVHHHRGGAAHDRRNGHLCRPGEITR